MTEEIRTEEIMETENVGTEDVKDGLTAAEYGVIGGIMIAGIMVFEGGKWVWKKTADTRGKIAGWFGDHKPGKKSEAEAEDNPDHEEPSKKAETKSKGKKTEDKETK